jgi:glycerol-3-phosphate dehydrogenase
VKAGRKENTAALSREHTIRMDASGLVTIAGGKWTTYRNMAEDCVNQAARLAGLTPRPSGTKSLNIHGHCSGGSQLEHLSVYGSDAPSIQKIIDSEPAMGDQLHPALPYCGAEITWAVRRESARSVEDVLTRRTRALFLNAEAAEQMTPRVAQIVANELGRYKQWQDRQLVAFRALAQSYRVNESAHAGKFGPLGTTE